MTYQRQIPASYDFMYPVTNARKAAESFAETTAVNVTPNTTQGGAPQPKYAMWLGSNIILLYFNTNMDTNAARRARASDFKIRDRNSQQQAFPSFTIAVNSNSIIFTIPNTAKGDPKGRYEITYTRPGSSNRIIQRPWTNATTPTAESNRTNSFVYPVVNTLAQPDNWWKAPKMVAMVASSTAIRIFFDKNLLTSQEPANSAWDVEVAGTDRTLATGATGQIIANNYVTLVMSSAATVAQAVTVSFTNPTTSTLVDNITVFSEGTAYDVPRYLGRLPDGIWVGEADTDADDDIHVFLENGHEISIHTGAFGANSNLPLLPLGGIARLGTGFNITNAFFYWYAN